MSLTYSVICISNYNSGTYLDLSNGQPESGTHIQGWAQRLDYAFFNQSWLLMPVTGRTDVFTLRNLRGGTYLDIIHGGRDGNGSQVHGWKKMTGNPDDENQMWKITPAELPGAYRFQNVRCGLYMDLSGGRPANGTKVHGWKNQQSNRNQLWNITKVSRTPTEIHNILVANPYCQMRFPCYSVDKLYIRIPSKERDEVYKQTKLSSTRFRSQIFDSDDFAFTARSEMLKWGNNYIRADGLALLFGVMFGKGPKGSHAFNWELSQDLNAITFFEPQKGQTITNLGYYANFGIF